MVSDSEIIDAFHELEPYVAPAMRLHDVDSGASLIEVGEPYLALDWMMGSICLPEVHVPQHVLEKAINCMSDEDKEEYQYLLGQ